MSKTEGLLETQGQKQGEEERVDNPPAHRIVAVGASAGGLEALQTFFGAMPENTNMTFVVIQHLSPDFKSLMDELLSRHTLMPVLQAEDGGELEANTIYLIPPGNNLALDGNKTVLSKQIRDGSLNLPIDIFFHSLAKSQEERSVAIVLSGTGSDGTRGIRAIKEAGGLVMAQDPESARFDGMPRSAISSGNVDVVMNAEELPGALLGYSTNPFTARASYAHNLLERTTRLDEALKLLLKKNGVDFTNYKRATATRRVARRMSLCGVQDVDKYLELLRDGPKEAQNLTDDLLIGVTRFFRDPESWETLKKNVLIPLVNDDSIAEIRAWTPGCSTGEEAYTLAIAIEEALVEAGKSKPYKIFATDVNEKAVQSASAGEYSDSVTSDIGAARVSRFFQLTAGKIVVGRKLREHLVFARHDVLRDAPFNRMHLVSCRNLLIYVQAPAQQIAMSFFHNSLLPGGCLFLGSSESVGGLGDNEAFLPLPDSRFMWKKNEKVRVQLPRDSRLHEMKTQLRAPRRPEGQVHAVARARDALVKKYAAPSLLLDDDNNILHSFGDVSPYLNLSPGEFSTQVTNLMEADLKLALLGAVNRATRTKVEVAFRKLELNGKGQRSCIDLVVAPMKTPNDGVEGLLVSFESPKKVEVETPLAVGETFSVSDEKDTRILELEHQLQQMKESLQATVEELETSNEELQATNEELIASNEELQSTNEELHSVNEELHTVNAEYQEKIRELTEVTADNENLLATTGIGVIFLSKDLEIRKYTRAAKEAVSIRATDIGRPMGELSHLLTNFPLKDTIHSVLETGTPFSGPAQNRSGRRLHLSVHPFLDDLSSIEGIVLSFVDVTDSEREAARVATLVEAAPTGLLVTDENAVTTLANEKARYLLGIGVGEDVIGRNIFDLVPEENIRAILKGLVGDYEKARSVDVRNEAGRVLALTHSPVKAAGLKVGGVVIVHDVTEQRAHASRLEESNSDLRDFAYVASHDLKAPLRAVIGMAELLRESTGDQLDEDCKGYLDVIISRSRRMSRFLSGLLEYSVVGRDQGDEVTVSLEALVDQIAEETVDSKKLTFEKSGLFSVKSRPVLVEQVLRNLIANASKFTPDGGKIQVRGSVVNDNVVLEVEDNGPGISSESLDKIFNLFHVLDSEGSGTGLGLAIAKKAAGALGGDLCVQSTVGEGTTFRLEVPKDSLETRGA